MTKDRKEDLPSFMALGHDEYVRSRFEDMPEGVKTYLELAEDFDARAHLEVCFRSEWYRRRHDQMQALMIRSYKKFLAAKAVLTILQEEAGVDDSKIEELLLNAFMAIGDIEKIPWDF